MCFEADAPEPAQCRCYEDQRCGSADHAGQSDLSTSTAEPLDTVTRALARACRSLAESGRPQEAGRLAATAWVALRESHPRQASRLDGVMQPLARLEGSLDRFSPSSARNNKFAPQDRLVDVRAEVPHRRHEIIHEMFLALAPDSGYILVNDHDPTPLYYEFAAEHPEQFSWEYLEQGPDVWCVRIGRVDSIATIPGAGR